MILSIQILINFGTPQIIETPGPAALIAISNIAHDTLEDLTMNIPYNQSFLGVNPHACTALRHLLLMITHSGDLILSPTTLAALSRLEKLQSVMLSLSWDVTWDLPGFQPLKFAAEVLNNVSMKRLTYLNVVWSPAILGSLSFNAPDTLRHPLLKTFEDSIAHLPLRTVVFSAARWRKNRHPRWAPALERAFLALRDRGILTIAQRPLSRKCTCVVSSACCVCPTP